MSQEFQARRLVEDMRELFAVGTIGFPAGYVLKGLPKGKEGLEAGLRAARLNVPKYTANGIAVGGVFFTTYYTMKYLRQKEDVWNKIVTGIPTSGLMFREQGFRLATRTALLYGPFIGIVAGFCFGFE